MITLIMLIVFSFIAGVLYRLGGTGGTWYKNTKVRDFGVPIIYILYLLYNRTPLNVYLIISAILLFASLTTYWKFISRWIGQSTETCIGITGFYGARLWFSKFAISVIYGELEYVHCKVGSTVFSNNVLVRTYK